MSIINLHVAKWSGAVRNVSSPDRNSASEQGKGRPGVLGALGLGDSQIADGTNWETNGGRCEKLVQYLAGKGIDVAC